MPFILFLVGIIGFLVSFVTLIVRAITKKPKKEVAKAFIIGVIFFIMFVVGITSFPKSETDDDGNNSSVNTTVQSDAETSTAQEQSTTAAQKAESVSIELIAGEPGEYGELLTLNKDTEFEETYYVYRVPAGTWLVTNTGKYMDQFNVYGETVYVTDAGWEELSDVFFVKVLDVGESAKVTIEDGQIIEIHEPGSFTLEKAN